MLGRTGTDTVKVEEAVPIVPDVTSKAGLTFGHGIRSKRKRTVVGAVAAAVKVMLPPLGKANGYNAALLFAKPAHGCAPAGKVNVEPDTDVPPNGPVNIAVRTTGGEDGGGGDGGALEGHAGYGAKPQKRHMA